METETPATKVQTVSARVPTASVVRPLRLPMSSERMFVMIPGAFDFRSNHDTCLWRRLSKSSTRTAKVRFSPPIVKAHCYRKVKKPMARQKMKNCIMIEFLSSL